MYLGINLQYSRIGPHNGLAPPRRPAVIWTNHGQLYWRIDASFGLNDLNVSNVLARTIYINNDACYLSSYGMSGFFYTLHVPVTIVNAEVGNFKDKIRIYMNF